MNTAFARLLPLFERERQAGRALVLATVVSTAGSTYRKAGAQMLIGQDGEYAGLLSGGCLEGDLREHALHAIATGAARQVSYDMRTPDDLLFGLGAGCEGAMDIFLQRVSAENLWQPLARLSENWKAHRAESVALLVRSALDELPVGTVVTPDGAAMTPTGPTRSASQELQCITQLVQSHAAEKSANLVAQVAPGVDIFLTGADLPPRLLLLGGGPDAVPVAELAQFLGWKTTIFDHRAAYALPERFRGAERVCCDRPEMAGRRLHFDDYQACVVMSHHLNSDLHYLKAAAAADLRYVGLLGPPARRERLLADLDAGERDALRARLHAPVGVDIGANSPESIALAIVTEIHAWLNDRAFTWPGG